MFTDFLQNLLSGGSAGTNLAINQNTMPQMSPDQWNNNQASMQPASSGVGGMFSDPNFISFLAGTGAALDPDGVGGAVGKATQGMVQNKQMGKAMEKQDQRWSALIDAIGSGKVGSASIKTDPKGGTSVSLKAPEEGLGTLDQPMQQNQPAVPQNPFDSYMSNMQQWFQKFGGGQ